MMTWLLALLLLQAPAYDRSEWRHWTDGDHDCQSTREEVLIAEAIYVSLSEDGCSVVSGLWYDVYTDSWWTDPRSLDVDHVVALGEAHRAGGWRWNGDRKEQYANFLDDPAHLRAVSLRSNRQKGDKDESKWLPPNEKFRCQYVRERTAIYEREGLTRSRAAQRKAAQVMRGCR
jgi:hypothetical protein